MKNKRRCLELSLEGQRVECEYCVVLELIPVLIVVLTLFFVVAPATAGKEDMAGRPPPPGDTRPDPNPGVGQLTQAMGRASLNEQPPPLYCLDVKFPYFI